MKIAAFVIGLFFIGYESTDGTTAEDAGSQGVQWACRDRYLWIHVTSGQTPRFEAVDENGVHSISEQLASRCGYTTSTFKMDGFTTFRASYYSCFTHNQNDEVFTFKFNVMVSDGGAGWISRPVSAICSGLSWSHREIVCEEDYMEVNINRESSCGGQRGESGQVWQTAFSQAQRMASATWQLMFLHSDGQVSAVSISEAQSLGYSLTATARRVVLRSQYSPPHAELMMVDGVPVEVVQVSLFFKQKLMVVMIDVSMACTVNSGSFDGTWLFWDVPQVVTPLVGEGAAFESRGLSLGVEGVMLDQHTASTRGFSLVQQGGLVQIRVPFGAEGGYRKSLVVNNVYKETYVIFLLYEHIFSLLYEDGSSVDTRHRLLRVLDTPLLCRPPFSLDQTVSDDQVFRVYLGNIPADVILEEVRINGKSLLMSDTHERGIGISPVGHVNGSQAYKLQLPFEDTVVQWTNLGEGVVQYSIDVNFTLTIVPQRESYYHHTFITARAFNAFPPEITAQCSDGGITFSVVRPPRAESLWEVGIDQEPLTPQLASQRGYRLHSDSHKTTLEVPVFSIGYTYEGINLSNFYGTFKLLLRDSKTLEVQTSTSKHCLFKTEDMIVCSADGTMTVVTTPTSTWPTVQPERTSLLDPSCGPKQTDRSRVLFEFKLDSCGTRAMVGDSYMVYENEILHDRQLITDGPNFISRESQFKLTVRCFYPLSGVNRLSVDRLFTSETSGFGSINVFESLKDSKNKLPARDCSHQASGNTIDITSKQVQQTPVTGVLLHPSIRPQPKPGLSHFITVPGGHNKLLLSSQNLQTFPNLNLSPSHEVPLQVPAHLGHFMFQMKDQHVFGAEPTLSHFRSSIVGNEMANTEERSGYQHLSQYDPSQTPPLYPVLQTPAHYSQDHISRNKLPLPGTDTTYVPTVDATHITSKNTIPDLSGDTLLTSQHLGMESNEAKVHQNLERTGSIERRNVKTIQSRVQNIRVKPLRKLASSGHHLSQKPSIQPAYLRSSSPSQYSTGQTAASSDGNHLMSKVVPDHRGSNTSNWTQSPDRTGTLRQEQGVYSVQVKPDQSAVIHLTNLSPNQQGHQQSLVQSVAEMGNSGGQRSASTPRKVLQPAGASRIRVRPAPGLPGRLQTPDQSRLQNLDSVTGGGTSRTPSFSFTLQNMPKSPPSIKEYKPTHPNTPSPVSHTGPGGSGSDLKTHTRSDCSSQYGVSVHRGIMRGKRVS